MDNIPFTLKDKEYRCFFELTLDIIGGKWKPVILFYIGEHEVLRYAAIRRCIPKMTERMLTKQLRELEKDGLVHREVYKQIPPKVEYSLTDTGKSIIPILNNMRDWGKTYFDEYDE